MYVGRLRWLISLWVWLVVGLTRVFFFCVRFLILMISLFGLLFL